MIIPGLFIFFIFERAFSCRPGKEYRLEAGRRLSEDELPGDKLMELAPAALRMPAAARAFRILPDDQSAAAAPPISQSEEARG